MRAIIAKIRLIRGYGLCFLCLCGYYFFINSRTAEVIALTPVRSVGSGMGAKSAE
jgi:hypothetical protein